MKIQKYYILIKWIIQVKIIFKIILALILENNFNFKNNRNNILAVENFTLEISVDKPLITKELKLMLNPLLINVIGAK